jgi:hypothetical protein
MVKLIPQPKDLDPVVGWIGNEEEQKRSLWVRPRIDVLLEARSPYEDSMERGLLLYSGKNRTSVKDPKTERVVIPMARIFVDTKTAEEVRAMKSYEFDAGKDPSDEWKVQFLNDVDQHVRRRVKMGPKKHEIMRMKNICGVGIARVGYRKVMRVIRDRIPGDEDGDNIEYRIREVPVYDDLFMDVVSPLSFAVDPNARTMDDAMDCVHFHTENWEVFYESYAKNKMFKNTEHVRPGYQNQVDIAEYFNKIRDCWVVIASPAKQSSSRKWSSSELPIVEIYEGPLPDDHKDLPFVSYHNNACFVSGFVRDVVSQNSTGEDVSSSEEVRAQEGFWTEGDPQTMMDLIDLRTGFGRAAYRAMKKAGEYIVATAAGHQFDESRPWRTGDQAIGMKDKFEVVSQGSTNSIPAFDFAFNDIFQLMVLVCGADPRNLAENKTKTATEAAIQRETSMSRLEQGLEYNEENGEVRLGTLIFQLIQQRYSKPELVKITGLESEEELEDFDEVEDDPDTGKPFLGKRYRTIRSSIKYKEKRRKTKDGYKYYLSKSEEGAKSFLSRPEYIRSSDIHVRPQSGRRAGEIRAIQIEQAKGAIELFLQLIPLSISTVPGGEAPIDKNDLPNIKKLVENYIRALGLNPDTDIGQHGGKMVSEQEEMEDQLMNNYEPVEINPPPNPALAQPMDPSQFATPEA